MTIDSSDRYRVQIAPAAARQLRKLPNDVQERLVRRIDDLAAERRPRGSITLEDDFYRIRVGDYRVIYAIRDEELIVLMVRVGHRRDVYQDRE
jgi:mRNA interferase RelE/StbE